MIYDTLYDWQKKLVDKFKTRQSYGLFLDCGLGKTPIGLGFAEATNCTKIIIITINSKATEDETIDGSWLWWAKKSKINYTLYDKKILKKCPQFDSNPGCLILNYESLFSRSKDKKERIVVKQEILDFIKSGKDQNIGILIDESHKVKDLQSLQTGAITKIKSYCSAVGKACYTWLLTGTPFTQGFIDTYAQLKLLGCQMNKTEFTEKFCVRGHIPGFLEWQQPIIGYKNVNLLYDLIHKFAITIKSDDVINLPEKIFVNHTIQETETFNLISTEKVAENVLAKKLPNDYDSKKKTKVNNPFYRNLAYPSMNWLADTTGVFWMRCRQASIGFQGNEEEYEWFDRSRLNSLKEFLKTHEDNYLLFYNYTPEFLEIYDICEELGYNIDVYSGIGKSLHFYEKYKSQSDDERISNKKNIVLTNFASGSTGMNWQLYNQCIIFSLPVYKDWEQGLKRIHRIGQKDTCVYHLFLQNNWLDKSMKSALDSSSNYTKEMFEADLKRLKEIKQD